MSVSTEACRQLMDTSPTFRLYESDRRVRFLGSIREGIPLYKIQTFRNILRGQRFRQEPSLTTVSCGGLEPPSHTRCKDRFCGVRRSPQYFPLYPGRSATHR